MRTFVTGVAAAMLTANCAFAQDIGVAMAQFDNTFLTILREGMDQRAKELGAKIQFEDAQNDVSRQMSQVENFISSGVDAIIFVAVDSDAIAAVAAQATAAGIPFISVNREPANSANLGPLEGFVGSQETEAGTLQATEACRQVKEKTGGAEATGVILAGDLFIQAGRVRTQMVEDYVKTPDCDFVKIADMQVADWSRTKAADLVSSWLSAGIKPDVVFANNDEMAIGAGQALRNAGIDPAEVVVAGIDATPDALSAMKAGDVDLTVFQDAKGQGRSSVDLAVAMAKGEAPAERAVFIPFELVTPANIDQYIGR